MLRHSFKLVLILSCMMQPVALAHKTSPSYTKPGAAVELSPTSHQFKQQTQTLTLEPHLLFSESGSATIEITTESPLSLVSNTHYALTVSPQQVQPLPLTVQLNGANHGYIHFFVTVRQDNGASASRALSLKLASSNYKPQVKTIPTSGKVFLPAKETLIAE